MKRRGFSWLNAILLLAGLAFMGVTLFPIFARQGGSRRDSCMSNLKQIGLGLMQYHQDYGEHFPRAASGTGTSDTAPYGWVDALWPYTKSRQLFYCPQASTKSSDDPTQLNYTDYWLNRNISALTMAKVASPSTTIGAGDGNDGYDATTARYSLKRLPPAWLTTEGSPALRHLEGLSLLFMDGHVKWFKPQKIVASPRNGPSFALR